MSSSVGAITVSNGSFYIEVEVNGEVKQQKIEIGSLMMAVSLGQVAEIDTEIADKISDMVDRNTRIEIALEILSVVSEQSEAGTLDLDAGVTINGTTKTLEEWLGDLGIDMSSVFESNDSKIAEVNFQIEVATEVISVLGKQLKGGTEDFDLTVSVTVDGTTKTLEEWLGDLGVDIPDSVTQTEELNFKLDAAEEIVEQLKNQGHVDVGSDTKVTVDGVTKTIDEWCEYLGIEYTRSEDLSWWEVFKGDENRVWSENSANAKTVRDNLKSQLESAKNDMQTLIDDTQSALGGLNTKLESAKESATTGMVDTLLADLQSTLDTLNTDSEADNLELQNLTEKRSLLLQQASVFVKSATDAMQSVLNNF